MRLPDPRRSAAVLIGTTAYNAPGLDDLPAVRNNVDAVRAALTHSDLGGLAGDRCVAVLDPVGVRDVYRQLRRIASTTEDTFIVYFAGHGLIELRRGDLFLGLADTDPEELRVSGLSIELIREVLADCPATNRVLILDCCFSGRAVGFMAGGDDQFLAQVGINGAFTLASAPANSYAVAPPNARFTAFTGELVGLLENGIPDGPELLTLGTIYRRLRYTMTARGLPPPTRSGTDTADLLALARNRAFTTTPTMTPGVDAPEAPPARSPTVDVVPPADARPADARPADVTVSPKPPPNAVGLDRYEGLANAGILAVAAGLLVGFIEAYHLANALRAFQLPAGVADQSIGAAFGWMLVAAVAIAVGAALVAHAYAWRPAMPTAFRPPATGTLVGGAGAILAGSLCVMFVVGLVVSLARHEAVPTAFGTGTSNDSWWRTVWDNAGLLRALLYVGWLLAASIVGVRQLVRYARGYPRLVVEATGVTAAPMPKRWISVPWPDIEDVDLTLVAAPPPGPAARPSGIKSRPTVSVVVRLSTAPPADGTPAAALWRSDLDALVVGGFDGLRTRHSAISAAVLRYSGVPLRGHSG